MEHKTFQDGIMQGRVEALEHMQANQNKRLDNHNTRLSTLEKALWIVIGAIAAMEFFPILGAFLRGFVTP